MIQVLIVDDDKLVRKGLISSMPWQQYGMEVAGEANNGENALIFMENHRVDLLVTDLSMPVMSGIELMGIVREKYPHTQIVVLTMHQDFEYVQDALRLGALDYIAKIQLEQEQFEAVLSRIVSLMEQKEVWKGTASRDDNWEQLDELHVLYTLRASDEEVSGKPAVPAHAEEADHGVWYWPGPYGEPPACSADTALVRFAGLPGMDRKSILQLIRIYRKADLFYHYDPATPHYTIHVPDIQRQESNHAPHNLEEIRSGWISADWIYDDALFRNMLQELKAMRLPPVRLARIFYTISDEWNSLYLQILERPIAIEDFFSSWHDFEEWLSETRERIQLANMKPQFSKEIQNSILRAVNLAHLHLNEPISASDIAGRVNMSVSYFSQCFKQYAGKTYTDYVRDLRMERAKEYLRNSTKTIQWISEQIGYNDEKYFSRLFREQVGLLPSEYRQLEHEV